MDGHDPVEDHSWYPDDYPGEPAADARDNFLHMFSNSTEDLFELVWEGGTTGQPMLSRLRSSPQRATAPMVPASDSAPSEDVMASWLYPIVSGLDHAGDSSNVLARVKSEPSIAKGIFGTMTSEYRGQILAMDQDMTDNNNTNMRSNSSERRKAASGGSSTTRSSQHSVTHNSTERRRRCKISDRLRTLQQLVPGCDKSNQASTLEQTIQYMKSLQQQVQSVNMTPVASAAAAAAAVYPVVQPPMPIPATATGQVQPGTVVPMVPYGGMIPYAHYHAVMMPATPSAVPLMAPAPEASTVPERQCSISTEEPRHKKERGKRRS